MKLIRLILVAAASVFAVIAQTEKTPLPGPIQPIAFSHKLHVGGQNLKCATCHKNAEPGDKMGLATASMCLQCHAEVKTESPEIQKLAEYAKEGREIKWRRVYQIPSYVFFSHRSHLENGATCVTCHGEVKELEQMYKVKEISMSSCMLCHAEKQARTGCTYCHDRMR